MIYVNGENMEKQEGKSLGKFLEERGYSLGRIAVECNGDIVPKAAYKDKILTDGDKLEVVNFVGGG